MDPSGSSEFTNEIPVDKIKFNLKTDLKFWKLKVLVCLVHSQGKVHEDKNIPVLVSLKTLS